MRILRPLEWAFLGFLLFVLVRAGPSVFHWNELVGSRATTLFFALGLVSALQLAWRFRGLPWADPTPAPRRMLWVTLPLSLLPWLFALWVVLRSPLVREELPQARPATVLAAVVSMFMWTVGFGLPTFLAWLVVANEVRERGRVQRGALFDRFRHGLSVLRDWLPLLLVLTGYEWMRAVVDAGFSGPADGVMQRADRLLFLGTDPLDLLQAIIWKPLTEVLAFIYSFYAVLYPLVLGTVLVTGGRRALRVSAFSVGFALLLAYVSYSLVPVKGPLFTREFQVPLDMYLIGPIKEAMMDATRISYDCFPSMHTCATWLLGACAWRWARRLFWVISPVVVLMPLACVYLRYHYVIDVLAGAALVPAILLLTRKLEPAITAGLPREESQP